MKKKTLIIIGVIVLVLIIGAIYVFKSDNFIFEKQNLGGTNMDTMMQELTAWYNTTTNTTNKAFESVQAGQNIWTGTEATGPEYVNLSTPNGEYGQICGTGTSTSNVEPKWRFNFTVSLNTAQISSINVSVIGLDNASEVGVVYIWNITSAALVTIGTLGSSNALVFNNQTGNNITNLINPVNKQMIVYIEGPNFDGGDCLKIDFAGLKVYTELTAPAYSVNSTNSTLAGSAIRHRLYWTDIDLSDGGYIISFNNGSGTFANDSWITFATANNWSNFTKIVNSTIGSNIQWIVYANDSVSNWNVSQTYSYTTTEAGTDCWAYTSATKTLYVPSGCTYYKTGSDYI